MSPALQVMFGIELEETVRETIFSFREFFASRLFQMSHE
jgi:hypothetical protein